jgi:predicted membrane protein
MGAHQSSPSMILISLCSTEASSITWKNTSAGIGMLRAAVFARSSTLMFLFFFNVLHHEPFEIIFHPSDES